MPTGVKAYKCSSVNEENLILTEETATLSAFTPYILYAEEGCTATELTGITDFTNYVESKKEGILTGAIVPQTVTNGYVLQKHDNRVKFFHIGTGKNVTIPTGKCWLTLEPSSALAYDFSHTTEVKSLSEQLAAGQIFDIQGKQVNEMKAGEIYIINGQTILKTR